MEIMFDTINLEKIRNYGAIYPFSGVTSNPSIVKSEGKVNFWNHIRAVRKIIGDEKTLHVQVVSQTYSEIVEEAHFALDKIDKQIFIKIPVSEEGLKAIKILKSEGCHITATCVYSKIQGDLAILAGADYIAPYFNRMENMNIDPRETIQHFASFIKQSSSHTKILAASFRNVGQVTDAFDSGADCVTIDPDLIHTSLQTAYIEEAIGKFSEDWYSVYKNHTLKADLGGDR